MSVRVLAYPTREGKFVLATDASDHRIGAVLLVLGWGGKAHCVCRLDIVQG